MIQTRRDFIRRLIPVTAIPALIGLAPALALAASKKETLSAPDAYTANKDGSVMLIDIRSPSEWADTGVPEGARAITMHDENGPAGFLENIRKAVNGDQSTPIALICARGVRTRWAQRFLTANGFTNVLDVSEGMFGRGSNPGWLKRDLPVSKPPAADQ